ncbi:hypothetical protein M2459_003128 [Parabacteroides sp. PF5-5]|uniref:SIR2 family protein n=1 Tax=Bacteroidales TaxID=171549 RepID=UPI0013D521E6|nr:MULTISPECIES: SIR2 family protein [Bacteroidales]MDH6306404.1 hypothetical protein [Parabacteroides sp. PH5-39]MDH6317444.1 hypothetical protein [Parabacteroides sp. PF5-13]MDH6321115.1 hypothetical protein [Parabacteroides sp. PH5-13]MDH6324847.1 hypothetical protein [Parabacteroides sp. PH5-8]MDH6328629.1 hypothetical protein [Parabacteroides sp. PH5-41]
MRIEKLKEFIQSANINFLIGSGLSRPYLSTLGDIETLLADLNDNKESDNIKSLVKGSIYKSYFIQVMYPNIDSEKAKNIGIYQQVIDQYSFFLEQWNQIIHNRGGSLLAKQLNIYTTNIDTFFENSAEKCKVELNDGFKGSVKPIFDEGNFQKSYTKNSVHFQNSTELPVFNLLKMHGSINWSANEYGQILNDSRLQLVDAISKELSIIGDDFFISLKDSLSEMIEDAKTKIGGQKIKVGTRLKKFFDAYEKLIIVNPTKRKFSETVLDIHFYDLMRMFSNSLEKENSLLMVMGFSFGDEHIASIVERATRTNPTLLVAIFAHSDADEEKYQTKFKSNSNVVIFTPTNFNSANKEAMEKFGIDNIVEFDFSGINKVFEWISRMIPVSFNYGK